MKLTSLQPQAPASLSPGRKIFNAAASVAVCSAIAGLGSTAKELVVARWFGRGDALDAFLIAFLLPSFLVNLVAGSFNAAMIPTFIQVREREGKEAAQRLFSGVMVVSLGLLVGVSVLVGILAPYFLPLLGSGFSPAKLMLTRRLLYALLPFIALSGLAVTWTAVLNAGEHFGLPALSAILTPLSIIAFLLLLGRTWGIFALAVGTVAGVALQAAVLGWMLRERGVRLEPRWYGWDPSLRQVIGQYAPMLAGALLMGSTELVDQSMAAMLRTRQCGGLELCAKGCQPLHRGRGYTSEHGGASLFFADGGEPRLERLPPHSESLFPVDCPGDGPHHAGSRSLFSSFDQDCLPARGLHGRGYQDRQPRSGLPFAPDPFLHSCQSRGAVSQRLEEKLGAHGDCRREHGPQYNFQSHPDEVRRCGWNRPFHIVRLPGLLRVGLRFNCQVVEAPGRPRGSPWKQ